MMHEKSINWYVLCNIAVSLPKGWKLPSSNSTAKGTFSYMLSQYGVQSKVNIAAGVVNSPVNGNSYDIALSPFFFVRGGYIYPGGTDKFRGAGEQGDYWSFKAYANANYAYFLYFDGNNVDPSGYYSRNRYNGQFLRCLISTP